MFSSSKELLDYADNEQIKYLDLRFTGLRGQWHHITRIFDSINSDVFDNPSIAFDGSSIAGWRDINESDMILAPDFSSAFIDPCAAQPTMVVICDIIDPITSQRYACDPRSIAKKAEDYMLYIADCAYFGPEPEFFIFDDARFKVEMNNAFYCIDSAEGPYNSGREYDYGNSGHRPAIKGGYVPVSPIDSLSDLRSEMLEMLRGVGIEPILHHHEVAPSQCELGFKYSTLVYTGDNLQKYKYVVRNVAASYGKTATFMPKPIAGDNGSGMHFHQSLWKDGKNLFVKNCELSEECLYYIGGIIKHGKAINAFANATTNSYKRLVPGFEAPVILTYSLYNRSAGIRIPYFNTDATGRIEARFPDPAANGYLCGAAMLMAGLDGIKNKIHPGDPCDENLYELSDDDVAKYNKVARSLQEAIEHLDQDRGFLKAGGRIY